jgi:peroxiredoxin Q/BCP
VIVGVSPDKETSQAKFKNKYSLPFTLLSDTEHKAAEAYGAWVEKQQYGRKYMGIERSTFVIGPDGKLEQVFRRVKAEGHAANVLEALA